MEKGLLLIFGILILGLQWGIAGNECKVLEEIEAVDDFGSTISGEPVTINVLENDIGDSLRVTNILVSPSCGEVVDIQENGNIVYVADADTECGVDIFEYEVEDNWGEKDTAVVTVLIQSKELLVQFEHDCTNAEENGLYSLFIVVVQGVSPFEINVNGIENILYEESGFLSYTFNEYTPYEILVIDSIGQEFFAYSENSPCASFFLPCYEIYKTPETTCIGDGKVRIDLGNENIGGAYWINSENGKHSLKKIDTIPNLSYLFIPSYYSYNRPFDTLLNCLAANDDFVEISTGRILYFNILNNDFGQNIKISQILSIPQCGKLLEWSANGEMNYEVSENNECLKDNLVYEIENDLGEKTTAMVEFGEELIENMYLEWEVECEDWECEVEIIIRGGVSPYTLVGTISDILESDRVTTLMQCGEDFAIEVIDSIGQMNSLEFNIESNCYNHLNCYEPKSINKYLEINCLGHLGGKIDYLNKINDNSLKQVFYIDSQNQYHKLSDQDTIPNHSYYYLELKHLGHIDGYINCLTTSIEDKNETSPNSFLQLYPNPNQGQFSLQIKTSKPSLLSYPIQVYNTAGQSIWKGTLQNNHFETLDLGNVGSGLYVLQVVMEEEVLLERFWVE